jgi:hypothetical protein
MTRFRVGDRVQEKETLEQGTVLKMPRDLENDLPECCLVLFDNDKDGVVCHRDDLRKVVAPRRRRL